MGSTPGRGKDLSILHGVQTDSAHSDSCAAGIGGGGVKWLGREADHSPSYNAEVKNTLSYTSTPPVRLYGIVFSEVVDAASCYGT
jgi:hypothetical protein